MVRSSLRKPTAPLTPLIPPERTNADSVLIAFGFRCNLACTFCMVEDALGVKPGTDLATFRAFAQNPQQTRGIRRIVLSGGEATLEPELLEYVEIARQIPGVAHVRVQTNATRLGAGPLLAELISAGVDEFFVSVHGADEPTMAAITQRPGSFEAIRAGLEAIAASPARLFTNTCTVKQNHKQLLDIVRLIAPMQPAGMDFWNLWPRVDHAFVRQQLVPVLDLQPHLLSALDECQVQQIPAIVKWFPRCLLGRHAHLQNDSQPTTLIDRYYWDAVPPYACLWAGTCTHAQTGCSGLSHAYIETFGWEETHLQPQQGQPMPRQMDVQAALEVATGPTPQLDNQLVAWAHALRLAPGQQLGTWTVQAVVRQQGGLRWLLVDGQRLLPVDVRERNDDLPAWQRTQTLDVSHGRVPELWRQEVHAALETVLERLTNVGSLPL